MLSGAELPERKPALTLTCPSYGKVTSAVPVLGIAHVAAAQLAGARLECGMRFAWPRPEEQYEFL